MQNLRSTDKLSLTSSSTAPLDIEVTWVDTPTPSTPTSNFSPDVTPTKITTATTADILAAPAASTIRNVKHISIKNKDASASNTISVQKDISASLYQWTPNVILLAGESLICSNGVWFHYDANGGVYGVSLPVASSTVAGAIEIADQTEMETATDVSKAVSPGRLQFHPASPKFWVIFTGNSTTILASYNMTSITDGTTQATVTIATDFSSANWCIQATAVAAAATAAGTRLASCLTLAAGSVIVFCVDGAATTALADPTSWCVSGMGDQ